MKLISLKCPSCDAKLEVNGDLKQYTCNYCGVTSLLDEEAITVKHIDSRLQTEINDVRDYYENANYDKAFELASRLLREYPANQELKKLKENSEIQKAIIKADYILNHAYSVDPGPNGYYSALEFDRDYNELNSYCDKAKDNKTVSDAFERLKELYAIVDEKNNKRRYKDLIIGIIILILILLSIIYILTR